MALNSTVLFDIPQTEIASLINNRFSNATTVKIVTGFATVEGIRSFEDTLRKDPKKLKALVIGAGTYKAYEAFDHLIDLGISKENLYVHLGHTRLTKDGATHTFYRYHPMLHSKVYYMENQDGNACAFIGSHNMTGFALMGLNGEASIMLEGEINDIEFKKIRNHIDHAVNEALVYQSGMKEAYAWWANQYFHGLVQKSNDIPKDAENKKTILVFCQKKDGFPISDEILYFELPSALGRIHSFNADVHVFVFDNLPIRPEDCLTGINRAQKSYWCRIEGIENDEGGKELSTDWFIEDKYLPNLKRAQQPFRPSPRPGMQQVRVRTRNDVYEKFDYLFDKTITEWIPKVNLEKSVQYDQKYSEQIKDLKVIPDESVEWSLVTGLLEKGKKDISVMNIYEKALEETKPESGAFILFSTRRRKKMG